MGRRTARTLRKRAEQLLSCDRDRTPNPRRAKKNKRKTRQTRHLPHTHHELSL